MGYMYGMSTSPIARQRKSVGMTQVQLASILGVSPGTVKRWEAGICAPRRSKMLAIEKIINVNASEVLEHIDRAQSERGD